MLNGVFQRPYLNKDGRNLVKKKQDEEKSTSYEAQREEQANQNAKSKGLQYVEHKFKVRLKTEIYTLLCKQLLRHKKSHLQKLFQAEVQLLTLHKSLRILEIQLPLSGLLMI